MLILYMSEKDIEATLINRAEELGTIFTDTSTRTRTRARKSTHTRTRTHEEDRLLNLLEETDDSLKSILLNSEHSDLTKAKGLQLLRQYEDDPENNSTSLSAIQLILKLPTKIKNAPISLKNTHEEILSFLHDAWKHMESQVYGHKHAKSEIIEYLVARLLSGHVQPRVLGLVGPPGVGKTTLAMHGIGHAMKAPFYHLSIGGLRDVNYFSGSLRCWKGAHQGMFTDILIKEQCLNPIIYIDELDKIATETSTDIYGILTHATDPLTNKYIQDHFLGIDIDLSKVTFIFSYNDPTCLPVPLRDRIKEIVLPGFNDEEKTEKMI